MNRRSFLTLLPAAHAGCSRVAPEERGKAKPLPEAPLPPIPQIKPMPVIPVRLPTTMKPGSYVWRPQNSPSGPVLAVVSIPQQILYVYRNGVAIGVSTVSTGAKGHETPTGVFTILQKRVEHYSNIYNNAPMPYMQRLTWSGIALHAGHLPGYPASKGCIRMPKEFSEKLYSVTAMGMTVVIAGEDQQTSSMVHPGLLAPTSPDAKQSGIEVAEGERFTWEPDRSKEGPVSILISTADGRIYVFRNGVEIGRSRIRVIRPELPIQNGVYTVLEGVSNQESPYVKGKPSYRYVHVGDADENSEASINDFAARVRVPRTFASSVYEVMVPGTTIVVTSIPAGLDTRSDPRFVVLTDDSTSLKKTS